MKGIKDICTWCAVFALFLGACADEDLVTDNRIQVKEGVPVTVSVRYQAASAVESRAAQTDETERKVNRVCVIAFRSDGSLSGRSFVEVENATGSGEVEVKMMSGSNQKIFLIANYYSGVGSLDRNQLDEIKTYQEFENLSSSLTEGNEIQVERMAFLMSGQMMNQSGGGEITVSENPERGIVDGQNPVELKRVDARISFNVFAENPDYRNLVFQPRYYRVERIPQGTYVMPRDEDYTEAGYSSMGERNEQRNFDGEKEIEGKRASYFEFYMLENRRQPAKRITTGEKNSQTPEYDNTGVKNLYALREKRKKGAASSAKPGQEHEPGDWVYANGNSTYVVIRGTLSYEYQEQFVNADVTYTVHLGNTGKTTDADDEDKVNNYSTERNTHYTYNVTITGVESIRVEVQDDKERRPGMEGDVIQGGGDVRDMDAHYGRVMFTLEKGEIKSGLSWAFSTPFQRGMKVFDAANYQTGNESSLQTGSDLNDYKWIKFAINKEYPGKDGIGTYSIREMVKFPGEDAYDGGKGSMSGGGTAAPAYGISDNDAPSPNYYGGREKVKLYDVNQLLNHLYKEATSASSDIFDGDDDEATVTITAYVDEFIYKYDPTEMYYEEPDAAAPNDPDLLLWKQTVNGDNRLLHICKSGAQYSPDGNSSWAESVISFSQRPVYTFYNQNNPDLRTAWGVESKGETGEIPVEGASLSSRYTNTTDNGRKNTLNIIPENGDLYWDQVVSVEDAGRLKPIYNNIWYACLLRNRDLNGDNIVQENEIRWYLASVDQLTDIWIGEAAIPTAKLYTKEATAGNVPLEHVASSSYFNSYSGSDTPWIIWAEEGASRSQLGQNDEGGYGDVHSYRCIRNLGLSLDDIDAVPDDYVDTRTEQYESEDVTYTEKIIDVSRMNQNTLRASSENFLLPYPLTERDESNNNRPPKVFAMIESSTDNKFGFYPSGSWESVSWLDVYANERFGYPCPEGYRMPNQRELMLMYTTFPDDFKSHNYFDGSGNYNYLCKTGFSFNGKGPYKDNNRYGFIYSYAGKGNYGNLSLISSDEKGKVRCVRDVIE